MSKKSLCF